MRARRAAEWLAAGVVFLGVALWQTRSSLGHWTTHYIGAGELEGWLWRYWWMKELVAGVWEAGSPLRYLLYVAAVAGSYPETGNVFDLLALSWPLEALLGAPLYYNLKVVLVLVLNGLAGFALGRYLFRDPWAALVCGLVTGASPYLLDEIDTGRIRQAILFPMPLYVLFLLETWRRPTVPAAVAAGLCAGLAAAVYLYYGMALVFLTALFVPWRALACRERLSVRRCLHGLLVLLVALTLTVPSAWAYVERKLNGQPLQEVAWRQPFPTLEVLLSPDPATVLEQSDPFLNSVQRFRADSLPWQYPFMPLYHRSHPLAFTLLALAALPLAARAREEETAPRSLGLWLAGALFFYALTLGPYLRTGMEAGYVAWPGEGVATPYVLLYQHVPFFSRLFSPVRMEAGMLVCSAVLCGAALLGLPGRLRPLVAVAVLVAAGAQMTAAGQVPTQLTRVAVPDYYRRLAQEPPCMIAELPFRTGDFIQSYQAVHGQKLLFGWSQGGHPTRYPEGPVAELARTPPGLGSNGFVRFLESLNVDPSKPAPYAEEDLHSMVEQADLRYVLVHERGCYLLSADRGRELYEGMRQALEERFGPPAATAREEASEAFGPYLRGPREGPFLYELAVFELR